MPAGKLYLIADEPRPGAMAHLVVMPVWPLFALMFAGPWLAWPWVIFNGLAMGSPNLRREIGWVLGGLVGASALLLAILVIAGLTSREVVPYLLIVLAVWKLGVGYRLYVLQSQTFELYQHFGGIARNGIGLVVLGALIAPWIAEALDSLFFNAVLR